MTPRLIIAIFIAIFVIFRIDDIYQYTTILANGMTRVEISAGAWIFFGLSIFLLLIGQWLRMLRTKLVIDQVKVGGKKGQFGALSVGYLFNVLLPFRIGELMRAFLIASRLQISFLYTFTAIAIERAIDLVLISILALLISAFFEGNLLSVVYIIALGSLTFSVFILICVYLLAKENKIVMRYVWITTNWFNPRIKNSLRFKVWTLIYGLQRFIEKKANVRSYAILTIASWVCLFGATYIIASWILSTASEPQIFVASAEPYLAVGSPAGSLQPETFILTGTKVLSSELPKEEVEVYMAIAWLVLVVPMAALGLALLFVFDWKLRPRSSGADNNAYANKLERSYDISQEFPAFLDTFFRGNRLTRILHQVEIQGKLSLVKFFKGGSDAVTMLVLQDSELYVKKLVAPEHKKRLKQQYDWLITHKSESIVSVVKQDDRGEYYAIDIEYSPDNIPFLEYVHSNSLKKSTDMLDAVWDVAKKHIYKRINLTTKHESERDKYVRERLTKKVHDAANAYSELALALRGKSIIVNGEYYDNLDVVMQKIKKNKQAWSDIAHYSTCKHIHGDFTIDNILVDTKKNKPLIIDPSDDNHIRGPVLDFGRQLQSLRYGYEFMCMDDDPVDMVLDASGLHSIAFNDHRSARYMQLEKHLVEKIMPKFLSEQEIRAAQFHAAMFYARMLTHRIIINPDNALKFYGIAVIGLNQFLSQYEQKS
jgi:RNAse (barnase) inhibitor barstar